MPSVLLVKNMVCHRCVLAVEGFLQDLSITYQSVLFGEIHLQSELTKALKEALKTKLEKVGFELIDDRMGALIEKMKQLIIAKARSPKDTTEKVQNLSAYLSAKLHHEYTYLSSLFSDVEGKTIEHYFIEQRIEKAKELLIYGQLTLSEIALELDYSSTAHLSSQFKKTTGLTPSHFKQIGAARRKPLDGI